MMKLLIAAAFIAACSCVNVVTLTQTPWKFNNLVGTKPTSWFSAVPFSTTPYNALGYDTTNQITDAGFRCDQANGCPLELKFSYAGATGFSKYNAIITPLLAPSSYTSSGSVSSTTPTIVIPLSYNLNPNQYIVPWVQEFNVTIQALNSDNTVLASATGFTRVNMTKFYLLQNTIIAGTNYVSVPATGKSRQSFSMANLVAPILITCTGYVTCSATEAGTFDNSQFTVAQFDANNQNGFFWTQLSASASHKLLSMATTNINIVDKNGVVINIPVSFANVFQNLQSLSLAPGQVTSAYGETGKTVYTNLQNQTITVNSVKNGRIPEDEYRNVSAGIVYAAVGSAFAFVLCLGAIAATIGAKSATKAAAV